MSKPFKACEHIRILRTREEGRHYCECIDCAHFWREYPLLPSEVY